MKGLLYYTSEMYTSTNYSITFRLAHQFSLLDKKKMNMNGSHPELFVFNNNHLV